MFRILAVISLLLVPHAVRSVTPEVRPGTCLYLIGAPAGAPAATTEETVESARVYETCDSIAHLTPHAAGDSRIEAWIEPTNPLGNTAEACLAETAIGHLFSVGALSGATNGHVDVTGAYDGFMFTRVDIHTASTSSAKLELLLEEQDPLSLAWITMNSATVFERVVDGQSLEMSGSFARRLDGRFRAGRTYAVRMSLQIGQTRVFRTIDFGSPGSGRNAHYDSIEVCLDAPPDDSALRARLDALEGDEIEEALYEKECRPSIWKPAANGGRLEEARALVADLITTSVATGDPGVNAHVAQMRLASADDAIAHAQYQRACRSLSDAVRALTTP